MGMRVAEWKSEAEARPLSLVGTPDPGGRPGVCNVRGTLMMDRRRQVGSRQLARPSAARLVAQCLP